MDVVLELVVRGQGDEAAEGNVEGELREREREKDIFYWKFSFDSVLKMTDKSRHRMTRFN